MSKRPHVTPRKQHDLARARELAKGIKYGLEDKQAFNYGSEGSDCTQELFDWVYELRTVLSLYEPQPAYDELPDE